MLFWIIAIALVIGSASVLVWALLRGQVGDVSPAAYDLQVYRDQLAEVDRDQSRGLLSAEDAERTRTEISRRILAADAQLQKREQSGPTHASLFGALALILGIAGGSWYIYNREGAPGYPDMSLRERYAEAEDAAANLPSQAEIEAMLPSRPPVQDVPEDFATLMVQLRETVAKRPDDLQGQLLLARNEASLGNYTAAHQAQARVIEIKGDAVTAEDYAIYAVMLITAANGVVSREARDVLQAAISRDDKEPRARYYMGLYFSQIGRPDRTFRIWRDLLEQSPPEAPWVEPISSQIQNIAQQAGVKYMPPQTGAMPGPNAADVEAAGQMSDADRQQMIRGMVGKLADRLASEGGSAEEWARLIGAYGVLGETDKARTVWTEAREVFADDQQSLDMIRQAATSAGVAE